MQKLVTLSAVALAGATIGVGSTFGWWAAEDPQSQSPQVAQNAPAELKIESVVPVEAAIDSEGTQIDIIGDSQVGQPKIAVIQHLDPAGSNLAKLAKELEEEAHQLEQKGQKEAAEEKRAVARRIREALPKVPFGGRDGKWLHVESPKHPRPPLERELMEMRRGLGTTDLATRKQLESQIRGVEMTMAARGDGPQAGGRGFGSPDQKPSVDIPAEARRRKMMIIAQGPGGTPPFIIEELRKVAENLQREGHKDQAQAVRQHADRLQQQAQEMQARVKGGAQGEQRGFEPRPFDGPRDFERRDGDRPRPETRNEGPRRPEDRGPETRDPRDHQRREHESGGFRGPEGHHPPMPMGHHHGEVLGLLQALHHEIGQLRGEVHQLRKMLGDGHHPQKGDPKHFKDFEGKGHKTLAPEEKAKLKAKFHDLEAKGKVKDRDDGEKGNSKHRDEDTKGKFKPGEDKPGDKGKPDQAKYGDSDDKGKAKNRDGDDDDDDRKDKKKNRDDDDDDDKNEDKNRKSDDDDEQLDDAEGVEEKAAEVKSEQED